MALPAHLIDEVQTLIAMGMCVEDVAARMGVKPATVKGWCKEHGWTVKTDIRSEVLERAGKRAIEKAAAVQAVRDHGRQHELVRVSHTDQELYDMAVEAAADVLIRHKSAGASLFGSQAGLIRLLECGVSALVSKVGNNPENVLEGENLKNALKLGDMAQKLAGAYQRVVETERKTHNLDRESGQQTVDDMLREFHESAG